MNEWGVVTVVIALVGLIATVAGPVVRLNSTINDQLRQDPRGI